MLVRNRRPYAVDLAHTDFTLNDIPAGGVADVPDRVAASLLEQPDSWEDASDGKSTVDDVLTEVGNDPDKARAALAAEQASGKPRKTLVGHLEDIIGTHEENS